MRLGFAAVAPLITGSATVASSSMNTKKPPTGEEGGTCYNL